MNRRALTGQREPGTSRPTVYSTAMLPSGPAASWGGASPCASTAPSESRTVTTGNASPAPAGVTTRWRLPSAPPPGADTQATTRSPAYVTRNIGVAPF